MEMFQFCIQLNIFDEENNNIISGNLFWYENDVKSKLIKIKRIGPMPHNGYRPFNVTLLKSNFKDIKIFSIKPGIKRYLESLNS